MRGKYVLKLNNDIDYNNNNNNRSAVSQPQPGCIEHHHWTRTTIGPYTPDAAATATPDADEVVARRSTADFAAMLQAAGIPDVDVLSHTGMQFARWHKTAINAAINPTVVLAGGCKTQATCVDAELYLHVAGVMHEILEVAVKVLGAPLPETLPTVEAVLQGVRGDMSGSRPSMWHDWHAGRPLELESIVGNVLRQAREVGVDVPRTQSVYALLKMAQDMRDRGAASP